jgi:dCTP deaminase
LWVRESLDLTWIGLNCCGRLIHVTPSNLRWEGYVTLEFSNTTPLPTKIYATEGVAQVVFFESDEVCETS